MQLLGKSSSDSQHTTPAKALQPPANSASAATGSPVAEGPAMALHEAERTLGLRNDAPWQQIEDARIVKVKLSSPAATAHLPGPEVARKFAEAKNANSAYAALLKARGLYFS